MAKSERWAAADIELWLTVGGTRYEVVQYMASFEINTVPTAVLTLAVGRNADTLEPAKIHGTYKSLRSKLPAEVWMRIKALASEGGAPNDWKNAPFRIFDGFLAGKGWRRMTDGAQFVVRLSHWLSKLNHSSAVSGLSHPGNPADWTYPSTFRPLLAKNAGGGSPDDPGWVPLSKLEGGITRGDLEGELWTSVIKPWMLEVSAQEPIDKRFWDGEDGGNKAAKAALDRMNQDGDYPPSLGMRLDGGDGEAVAMGVNNHLRTSVGYNAANTTLWGKLVNEWSPAYWFAVIPRVENALVVPFTGPLQGKPFCTIRAGEYVAGDINEDISQNLRCVGILHPLKSRAGAETNPGEMVSDRSGLAGLYPAAPKASGLVMLKAAPPWLADPVFEHVFSRDATGIADNSEIQTAYTPKGTGKARKPARDPANTQKDFTPIMDQYAHAWFTIEKTRDRNGEIDGRLRFDISPGSQVKIEGGSDLFVAKDGLGEPIFAVVTRVSYMINAEARRASTSFSLAWTRDETENGDEDFAASTPPLYNKAWMGSNLIDGYKPPY